MIRSAEEAIELHAIRERRRAQRLRDEREERKRMLKSVLLLMDESEAVIVSQCTNKPVENKHELENCLNPELLDRIERHFNNQDTSAAQHVTTMFHNFDDEIKLEQVYCLFCGRIYFLILMFLFSGKKSLREPTL